MSKLDAPSKTPDADSPAPGESVYLTLNSIRHTLQSLVRINSVNPAYGGPTGGEREALEWAREFLAGVGVEARLEEWGEGGRYNLRARLEGRTQAPPLLFETHIDTVSVSSMSIEPFGAAIDEGRLTGRGATDAKAQAAAMLHAIAAWAASGHRPERPIELALVSDEEYGFGGAQELMDRGLDAAGIVIGEPTDLRLVTTHKGTIRVWVQLEGKSAHGAKPHLGINAISMAAALVTAIDQEYAPELAQRHAPLLEPPTINVGIIEGGLQANLVPPRCRVHMDRRIIPGETEKQFIAEMELLLHRLHRRLPEFKATLEPPTLSAPAVATDPDHPLVRMVGATLAARGLSPEPVGVDYATDAAILADSGLPIVIVGPGSIDQAHTADEYVELEQVLAGAQLYAELIGRAGEF